MDIHRIEPWDPPRPPKRKMKRETWGKAVADSPDHGPRAGALPEDLDGLIGRDLEYLLINVESEILTAKILSSDEDKVSAFLKNPGIALFGAMIPLAIAGASSSLIALTGMAGLVLFTIGSLNIRVSKREAALQARNFDRERILRAIERKDGESGSSAERRGGQAGPTE